MKKVLSILLVSIATVYMSGCATVFTGDSAEVSVRSVPSGALVYDDNGAMLGRTPCKVDLSKDSRVIELRKKGYETAHLPTNRKFAVFPMILDVFLWPTLIVDAYTGACYDIRTNYSAHLSPLSSTASK